MEAITREEKIISGENLTPITRKEMFLAKAAGMDVETPEPITREEIFLSKIQGGSGGGTGGDSVEEWIGDGKTHLWIKIAAEGRMDVPLYFQQTVANGVTIDWGDGSATETLSGGINVNTTHTYAAIGEYVISLDVADGCTLGFGHGSMNGCVMGSIDSPNRVYCNMLKKVEIGNGVTSIGDYAFQCCLSLASIVIPEGVMSIGIQAFLYCLSLASIVIPEGVTSIDGSTFSDCRSLASIVIPEGVTSIANSVFNSCSSLASIVIPEGVTSIEDYAFKDCLSLASIVIPEGVMSIGFQAFIACCGMKFYDFTKHIAVPTLSNANVFKYIPSDCEIRVPAALYDEWISATNWSTYADKIVAV